MEHIRISVRNLVEFLLCSGDIDNRRGGTADKEAMQLGSKIHRKIQGQMGSSYQAEVPLKYVGETEEYELTVEGRADGIQVDEGQALIDEIKGVYMDLEFLKEPIAIHLAQAKCYGYIYCKEKELSGIQVQLTYCNMETEIIKRFCEYHSFIELRSWFEDLLEVYHKWATFQIHWKKERQGSILGVEFPFSYREGQKDLAGAVYRTIARKKKLFIQAPTGVGKTISTVFPAVKAVGEGLGDKLFYLTAKTITRTVAADAFRVLTEGGLRYKVISLTAKDKICMMGESDCNPVFCPYAKGHYDRVNDAVFEMLQDTCEFSREALVAQAEKWQVCPFELSLDVSLWVDAIICDYNYVFDPRAKLKRFFGEGVKGDYLFLIDEAHNLVERGREMYSAALYKEDFLSTKKAVKSLSPTLERKLEKCNRILLDLKRESETYQILENAGHLCLPLMNLAGEMEKFLDEHKEGEANRQVLELYFAVQTFLETHDKLDDNYVVYTELEQDGRFKIKLYCVDTSVKLQECLDKGNAAIFFSATLLPIQYYLDLLSTDKDNYTIYADTPFEEHKRKLLVGTDVSSKYTRRGEAEYRRMANYISQVIKTRPGNYLAFFPSYVMMQEAATYFEEIKNSETKTLLQNNRMNEQDREEFLATFEEEVPGGLVGFCVMGGIFGEGIDLKNDRLIGAIIVGTGLPQVCNEREILKKFYEDRAQDGFAYAYRFPGMNKVQQCAGRVIRTQEDIGVVLLLDERFLQNQYQRMFPREWLSYETCNIKNVEDKLKNFWEMVQENGTGG